MSDEDYSKQVWAAAESGGRRPRPSIYACSLHGRLELFLLELLENATKHRPETQQSYWFGAYNAIGLYRFHPSYSPFVEPWSWSRDKPLETSQWDMRDVMIDGRFMTQEEWLNHVQKKDRDSSRIEMPVR